MRILWTGVAAWAPSGYGVATNNIVTRLQKLGHEVKVLTYYGLHGGRVVWNGIEHLPVGEQQFGSDVIGGYIAEFQPDVVITLYDQWVIPSYQQLGSVWLPYVVLHYEPMESALKEAVKGAWRCWALCDWAADVMRAEGIDARAVPLGVDTNVFRPLLGMMDSDGNIFEQQKLKQMVGCPPDQFLVTMVAANRDFRKHLEPQFRVFADFHRKYPDSHLFIKTNASAKEGGWDLPRLWQRLFDLKKKGDVAPISYPAADQATVDPYTLATFYNASDVYLCCFVSGTPVLTSEGVKPIEAITTGTLVMTHKGRWMPVTAVHERSYTGPLLSIFPRGHTLPITCTPEHPWFTARIGGRGWTPASSVHKGTFLCTPRSWGGTDAALPLAAYCAALPGKQSNRWKHTVGLNLPDVPVDEATARFLGLWVSEGCADREGSIRLSFCGDEVGLHKATRDWLEQLGLHVTLYNMVARGKNTVQVGTECKALAQCLRDLCGHGARHKHLPHWAFTATLPVRLALLRGLFEGDGSRYWTKRTLEKPSTYFCIAYSTISEQLAYEIHFLLASLGYAAETSYTKHRGWNVRLSGSRAEDLATLIHLPPARVHSSKRIGLPPPDDEYTYTLVRAVESKLGSTTVYNLSVAEDESYLVSSFAVHNCSAAEGYGLPVIEAQACSIPVIGTDYSAMRDIIGSGWKLPYRRFVTPMYSYGAAVDEDALFKALEEAYHMRGTPEYAEMKRKAREHALKYDWDKIVYGTMQRELAEWLEEREL